MLRRTLRGLSDETLTALVRGIDAAGDRLAPGRLFRGGEGGCAVGVTLRQLEPETFAGGGVGFRLRHAWRRRVRWYRGLAKRQPRLQHLEWSFDRAVGATRRQTGATWREAGSAVGRWFRTEAEAELDWRGIASAAGERWPRSGGPSAAAHLRAPIGAGSLAT